jgi:hypothetical protein
MAFQMYSNHLNTEWSILVRTGHAKTELLKTRDICPVFIWSTSRVHFIFIDRNFPFYIKLSSLSGKSPARFSNGLNKMAAIAIQKQYIYAQFSNGPLA